MLPARPRRLGHGRALWAMRCGAALAAALCGCGTPPAPPQAAPARATEAPAEAVPVPAAQVLALLQGNTPEGVNEVGSSVRYHVRPDRCFRMVVRTQGGRVLDDAGCIRLDGDRLCFTYEELMDGNAACSRYVRAGDRFWTQSDSGRAATFTITPGNPYGL